MGGRRRNGKPPEIPGDQRQDYDRYRERLRRANWEAADLLIALFHVCSDAQQSLWCCRQLRTQMEQMKVWLNACDEVVAHASEWRPTATRFRVLPPSPCKACVDKAQSGDGLVGSAQSPQQEPHRREEATGEAVVHSSWGREVDLLLWLSRTSAQRVTEFSPLASISVRETLKCLNDLIKLFSRQQRHVTLMGSRRTHSSFAFERNCQQCGQEWTDPYAPDVNPKENPAQVGERY